MSRRYGSLHDVKTDVDGVADRSGPDDADQRSQMMRTVDDVCKYWRSDRSRLRLTCPRETGQAEHEKNTIECFDHACLNRLMSGCRYRRRSSRNDCSRSARRMWFIVPTATVQQENGAHNCGSDDDRCEDEPFALPAW